MSTLEEKPKASALRSILAGSTAGAVEIAITYPAEFAKTRAQLNRRLAASKKLPWPPFGPQWYAGCTTLVIGNAVKAGVRFTAYDTYTNWMKDAEGNISGPATVIAGFGTGITESVVAVTPFESIKTQLIDDRKSENPRMRGFLHGSRVIAQEKGIRGFFQGFLPTTLRQGANSAVRFSSYAGLKHIAQGYAAPGEKLGAISTFGIGALAGIITVYVTMPLDTVKTRMQSLEAKTQYKSTLNCAVRIFKEESVLAFWSGALPRLMRLSMSGGIVFTIPQVRKINGLFRQSRPGQALHLMTRFSSYPSFSAWIISVSEHFQPELCPAPYSISYFCSLFTSFATYLSDRMNTRARLGCPLVSFLHISIVTGLVIAALSGPSLLDRFRGSEGSKPAARMAWRSSGSTNAALIANLMENKIIKTERVKQAMLGVDRANYSPALPYMDSPQSIGFSATISAPHMHAAACEDLLPFLKPGSKVLDIGSGSGYLTHVFAELVKPGGTVIGVDHIQGLVDMANRNMAKSEGGRQLLESKTVRFVKADGRLGFLQDGPYDAIHVGAAAAEHHQTLVDQLKKPGRLFVPVEENYLQHIYVIDKREDGTVERRRSYGVRYVPLTDAPKTDAPNE